MIGINSTNNMGLFKNNGAVTINSDHILFLENKNNMARFGVSFLLSNSDDANLTLNGNAITINGNTITSLGADAYLVNNLGTMTIGSVGTEILNFRENKVSGKNTASLFNNNANSTINLNGNSISITDNIISPIPIPNSDSKYSVVIRNNGTLNINLYGDNSSFTLADNRMTGDSDNKGVKGIINNSQINFTNYHNSEATIKLEHDIIGGDESVITFRGIPNGDNNQNPVTNEGGSGGVKAADANGQTINAENIQQNINIAAVAGCAGGLPLMPITNLETGNNDDIINPMSHNGDNNNNGNDNNNNNPFNGQGSFRFELGGGNRAQANRINIEINTIISKILMVL